MAKCRGCGREIIWIRTPGGKAMPCDPEQVMYWAREKGQKKIVTPNGEVISCTLTGNAEKATGLGYISHWSTCPEAGRFRME